MPRGNVGALARRVGTPISPLNLWYGESATTAMTHSVAQDQLDGDAVEWLRHVIDERSPRPNQPFSLWKFDIADWPAQ